LSDIAVKHDLACIQRELKVVGMRDEFDEETKELLAKRVGYRCSNPNCRLMTSGPQTDPMKTLDIGVAAHITAASLGGKRYDPQLSAEERKSPENGIWLCQNHGKLVDNNEVRYSVDILNEWKRLSERADLLEIEGVAAESEITQNSDVECIQFYSQCLNRPAFQDSFMQEGSMEAFDRAVEDTITAINTGCLRSRDGGVLIQAKDKSYLSNRDWGEKKDVIVDLLRAIRSRYALAIEQEEINVGKEHRAKQWYCIYDEQVAGGMDNPRAEIIGIFSEVCKEAGIPGLKFPRNCGTRLFHW
jgi:hypothetical protein